MTNWIITNKDWIFSGVGVAIITIIFSFVFKKRKGSDNIETSVSDARKEIVGKLWVGNHKYQTGVLADKKGKSIPMEMSLNHKRKKITGTARYEIDGKKTELVLSGGFYSDALLRLEYTNSQKYQLHFGFFLLKLNAEANKLEGAIVGYGRNPDRIFTAIIELYDI